MRSNLHENVTKYLSGQYGVVQKFTGTPPYQILGQAPEAEKAFLNISLPSFDDDFTFPG